MSRLKNKILSVALSLAMVAGMFAPMAVEASANLALGKTAVADSQEAASVKASNAVDGDTTSGSSRWGSGTASTPHWIYVDLGESKTVQSVRILWEQRKPTAYRIQASDDANSWTDLKVISKRPAELDDVIVLDKAVETRYVRLYIDSFSRRSRWRYYMEFCFYF